MADIDDVLDVIEPVGVDRLDLHVLDPVLHHQHVEERQQRRGLGAHIGPDEAAQLLHLVGSELDLVLEAAALGLGRLLQALAGPVIEPAVIRAAKAVAFDPAVIEREAAMGAAQLHQRRRAALAAIEHQLLAQNLDPLRLAGDEVRAADRMPIAPQHRAHARAGTDAGEKLVLFRAEHGSLAAAARA